MGKIFQAKKIITMDGSHPFATHVAVDGNLIVGVGDSEIKDLFPSYLLDTTFQNDVLLPGFIEGHAHLLAGQDGLAAYVGYFDRPSPEGKTLKGLTSMDEIITYLSEYEKTLPPGKPVMATGFDPIYFAGQRPTRYDLDKVTTDRMVFLLHASGHIITANSKALDAIPQDKLSTSGIAKDTTGKPSGELQEVGAMLIAFGLMGEEFVKFTDPKTLYPRFSELARRAGVTTITDMGVDLNLDDPTVIEEITALTENDSLRLVPMYFVATSTKKPEEMPVYVKSLENKNTEKLRFGLTKLMADGSIQGYTARLKQPYVNGAQNGIWNMDPEKLKMLVKIFNDSDLSVHCHCNGDEASEAFIAAVREALASHPFPNHRHTVQHAQMVDEDQYAEMKTLNMCANIFTNHIYYWGDQHAAKTIGQERAEKMDAANTALSLGVPFSLHCDANVTPIAPLFNAWTAVTRLTSSGKVLGEKQKIPVEDALYAMTLGSAYLLGLEKEIGSITVGKKADFVVLGEDPYAIDPIRLKDIPIITTIFGGEITIKNIAHS